MTRVVDLRSDTVTRPGEGMRAAMADAEVGDDVLGEDPTVNALEARAAALLGKESAIYVPTGTMANLVAFLAQTRAGDTVILSEQSHPVHYEGANIARFGGLLLRTLPGERGKFTPEQLGELFVEIDDPHVSPMTMAAIENTTNRGSGACYDLAEVEAIGEFCRDRGIKLHCDGARLFNASVALGVPASALARPCDSVSFCLSKGLGAPMGSLLVGGAPFIHEARRVRKQLGGGMRQAGIAAAAGLYALDHHIDDLAEDHRRARQFREALENAGIEFTRPSPTNILMVRAPEAHACQAELDARGVRVFAMSENVLRAVFHRDISDDDLDFAVSVFRAVLGR